MSFFCKECGRNRNHSTVDCYKIKNRIKRKANKDKPNAKPFSKRSFKKEINALARKAKANGAMELYSTTVAKANTRFSRVAKKAGKISKPSSESEDQSLDSAESINNLEKAIPRKKATAKELPYFVPQPVKDRMLRFEEGAREEERAFLRTCVQIEQKENRKQAKKAKDRKAAQERCSNKGEDTTSETETVE